MLISIKFTEKNCDSSIQFHKKILSDRILDERYLIDKYMNKYYNILCSLVWLAGDYIVTCNKCGYISAEKLSEKKAKELLHSHVGGLNHCTIGHIKLMKVRT